MTTLTPVTRLRRTVDRGMVMIAFAFVSLAVVVAGMPIIAADPIVAEVETTAIRMEGADATDPRPSEDYAADPVRNAALGNIGGCREAGPPLASREDRDGSTHRNGVPIASLHEVRAYLLGTAIQLHVPASVKVPPPHCVSCAAARAYADRIMPTKPRTPQQWNGGSGPFCGGAPLVRNAGEPLPKTWRPDSRGESTALRTGGLPPPEGALEVRG